MKKKKKELKGFWILSNPETDGKERNNKGRKKAKTMETKECKGDDEQTRDDEKGKREWPSLWVD